MITHKEDNGTGYDQSENTTHDVRNNHEALKNKENNE